MSTGFGGQSGESLLARAKLLELAYGRSPDGRLPGVIPNEFGEGGSPADE